MLSAMLQAKVKFGVIAALLAAMWCLWLWRPERQVRVHQRELLEATQNRKWSKVKALLDDDFHTRFGQDKPRVLQQAAEVLRPFFALQIVDSETVMMVAEDAGKVRTRLRLEGKGVGMAELTMRAVNQSNAPFTFSWRRVSWMPWDWRLVSADHPLMSLGSNVQLFW